MRPSARSRPARRVIALALLVAGAPACAWVRVAATGGPGLRCEGPLVDTHELPGDFEIRDRLRVDDAEGPASLATQLEKRGSELVLVGIQAWGNPAFEVQQNGTRTRVQTRVGGSPLHPLAVLRALHAVHFFALPGAPRSAGLHRGRVGEVEVEERWEAGRLRERRIEPRPGAPAALAMHFESAGQVSLHHAECGYEARLRFVSDSRSD